MIKAMIVAGNYAQYRDYIAERGYDPQEYRHVAGIESLFGILDVEVRWVGTYWQRDDYKELVDAAVRVSRRLPDAN